MNGSEAVHTGAGNLDNDFNCEHTRLQLFEYLLITYGRLVSPQNQFVPGLTHAANQQNEKIGWKLHRHPAIRINGHLASQQIN